MNSLQRIVWGVAGLTLFVGLSESPAWAQGSSAREARTTRGGAQLWAQTCARCHNIRSPASYSDREWDVFMHHMRVRANLTAEEHEAIRDYLKSGN